MTGDDEDLPGEGQDTGFALESRSPRPPDPAHDDAAQIYAETLGLEVELAGRGEPGSEVDLAAEVAVEDRIAVDLSEHDDADADDDDDDDEPGPDSEDDIDEDDATLHGEEPAAAPRRGPWRGLALVGLAGGLWTAVAVMRCDETEPPSPSMAVTADADQPEPPTEKPKKAVEVDEPPAPTPEPEPPLPPASDPNPPPAEWAGDARPPKQVTYTVRHGGSIKNVANLFKIFHHEIQALNPGIALDKELPPNTRVVVYKEPSDGESQSVGLPSNGSLENGVPMLEGPGRHLKAIPWKAWATAHTVGLLDQVLRQWQKAGHAQPVLVGNMSARSGGRLQPHSTHQSGRDVDLGYMQKLPPGEELNWREMSERNLDGDETWALIKLLVQTGEVEVIYIDRALQKLLYDHALGSGILDKRALRKWMEYPGAGGRPLIRHVDGHVDHMHVRFKCQPAEPRCRSKG